MTIDTAIMFTDVELEGNYDPLQKEMMKETVVVVDEQDKVLGYSTKQACHLMENIDKGLLHRAFSVFLFNEQNQLLLQQRAASKITFPLMWTNTCCSHMLHSPEELDPVEQMGAKRAGQRKLEQELGIKPEEVPLEAFKFLTRIHYKAPSGGLWGEHEVDYIMFVKRRVTVELNENECHAYKYVSQEELREIIRKAKAGEEGLSITPWFALIAETFLFKWWNDLDHVETHQDAATIHRFL